MNLWIPHQKTEGTRHYDTMQHSSYSSALQCVPRLNHWQVTLPFCFDCSQKNYSHVPLIKHHYVYTKDSSSNKSTKYECWNVHAWCKNYGSHSNRTLVITNTIMIRSVIWKRVSWTTFITSWSSPVWATLAIILWWKNKDYSAHRKHFYYTYTLQKFLLYTTNVFTIHCKHSNYNL